MIEILAKYDLDFYMANAAAIPQPITVDFFRSYMDPANVQVTLL